MPDAAPRSADARADHEDSHRRVDGGQVPERVLLAEVSLGGQAGERRLFTYRVPERLATSLGPGYLVEVPLGNRALQGVVVAVGEGERPPFRLRDVQAVLDPLPALSQLQLDLAAWIAGYYGCALDDAVGLMVPASLDREQVVAYSAAAELPMGLRLTEDQRRLLLRLQQDGPLTAAQAAGRGDYARTVRTLESLARRKLLRRDVQLGRTAVVDKTEQVVVLQPRPFAARATGKQADLVSYLEGIGGEATVSQVRADTGADLSVVRRLQEKGIVVTYARQVRRDPLAHRAIQPYAAPEPSPAQARALSSIEASIRAGDGAVFLLHGVTGSGKTEVYLRAVAAARAMGKRSIVLVPEIGLTPQTVDRFAGRFPNEVALLHSRLSDGERHDEWQRIRGGGCTVVVGPRSAIFSPVSDIGLIVLDEEHDASYKQDRTPRYHAREVAVQIARLCGATVVLGSATPDVVSYSRADAGAYRLLRMDGRVPRAVEGFSGSGLPPVQIVDMRLELKAGNRSIFSRALARELELALARREQAILFLNRRGNATFVNCRDCGRVVKCLRCDLPFAYHSDGELLRCHRCDAQAVPPSVCDGCGSWRIRYFGLGTQKIEQEMRARFPRARVLRYDRDVISGKLGHEQILDRFASRQADILIGTQIVAKGLDFPFVTVVGAVSADTSMNLPDFRAAERTFQLLTQVAGRAGRAALPGTVIVQTYAPGHFAVQAAASHDYTTFYTDEMRFRRLSGYPPFSQLLRLTISGRTDEACRRQADELTEALQRWMAVNVSLGLELIGPAPCFINKANNNYFWQILVRGADVHPILSQIPHGWAVDVDPMNLL